MLASIERFPLIRALRSEPVRFVAFTAFVFLLYLISSRFRAFTSPTPINNHVVLADAWLHGHLWVANAPMTYVDCVMYHGKCYVIEGPMPAVLLLPLVFVFGLSTNQSLVCALIAAAGVAAFDAAVLGMKITGLPRSLAVASLGLGTVFWWCAVNPNVWMFDHVVCASFLLFALAEWFGKRRSWLVGLFIAGAALTRFPVVLAVLPFMVWAWFEGGPRQARSFLLGFMPLMLLDVGYNFARWHTPIDIGYTLWYHQDPAGSPTGYPLSLSYLPYNLYSFLFLAPGFSNAFPWIQLNYQGTALTFTSPVLLMALCAPRSRESLMLWSSAILVAVPDLLYYVNGYAQFGMRHSLDFTPFLACLVARGLDRRTGALGYFLVVYSVCANAFGVGSYKL